MDGCGPLAALLVLTIFIAPLGAVHPTATFPSTPMIRVATNASFAEPGDNVTLDIYTYTGTDPANPTSGPFAQASQGTAPVPVLGLSQVRTGLYRAYLVVPPVAANGNASYAGVRIDVNATISGTVVYAGWYIDALQPGLYLRFFSNIWSLTPPETLHLRAELLDNLTPVDADPGSVWFYQPAYLNGTLVPYAPVAANRTGVGVYEADYNLGGYALNGLTANATHHGILFTRTLRFYVQQPLGYPPGFVVPHYQAWYHLISSNDTLARGDLWVADAWGRPAPGIPVSLEEYVGTPGGIPISGTTDASGRMPLNLMLANGRAGVQGTVGGSSFHAAGVGGSVPVALSAGDCPRSGFGGSNGGFVTADPSLLGDGSLRDFLVQGTTVVRHYSSSFLVNDSMAYVIWGESTGRVYAAGHATSDAHGDVSVGFSVPDEDVEVSLDDGNTTPSYFRYSVPSPVMGLNVGPLRLGGGTEVRPSFSERGAFFANSGSLLTVYTVQELTSTTDSWTKWGPETGCAYGSILPVEGGLNATFFLPSFLPSSGKYVIEAWAFGGSTLMDQYAVLSPGQSANIPGGGRGEPGLENLVVWGAVGLVVAAGGAVGVALILRRRKRAPPQPKPPEGGMSTELDARPESTPKNRKLTVVIALAIVVIVVLSAVGYLVLTGAGPGAPNTPHAAAFVLQAPAAVVAGSPFQATLKVEDQSGTVFTGYRGTVQLGSNDSAASLPASHVFSSSDAGIHTFTGIVFRTPGVRSLVVSDTANANLTARALVGVSPGANHAPTITQVSSTPDTAEVGQTVSFRAVATDPDGDPLSYAWDFGDGMQATGALSSHAYARPGHYIIAINVSDGRGGFAPSEHNLTFLAVYAPVAPQPSSPTDLGPTVAMLAANQSNVQVGASVTFSANASWTYAWVPEAPPSSGWYAAFITVGSPIAYVPSLFSSLQYSWGDGTVATVGSPATVGQTSHVFVSPGNFPVVLNITRLYNGTLEYAEAAYTVHVTTAPPVPLIKSPKVFTNVVDAVPGSLDPAVSHDQAAGEVIQNVYETLVRHLPGSLDTVNLVPALATQLPSYANGGMSADGKNYTFTLVQNVTFHDGSHLTATDVAFSIQRVMAIHDPAGPSWTLEQVLTNNVAEATGETVGAWVDGAFASRSDVPINIAVILGPQSVWDTEPLTISLAWAITNSTVEVVSTYQVLFHLTRSYAGFLQILASPAASVLSKSCVLARGGVAWGQHNLALDFSEECGTGPFALGVVQPHQRVSLTRFASYWSIPASLPEVEIVDVEDVGARELMLFSGDADTATVGWANANDVLTSDGTAPKYTYISVTKGIPTLEGDFAGFNRAINVSATPDPWVEPTTFFADIHVRKAFSYAFDYNQYVYLGLYEGAARLNGPIPMGLLGYNANLPVFSLNLYAATLELQQAIDPRTNVSYWNEGFTITLYYVAGNTAEVIGDLLLKSNLESLVSAPFYMPGSPLVSVRALNVSAYNMARLHGGLPMIFVDLPRTYADPDAYVTPLLRTGRPNPESLGYGNATLSAMIDAAALELNQTIRAQMYQTIANDTEVFDIPYIWLDQRTQFYVERVWVRGYYFNACLWGLDYSPLAKM